MLAFVISSHVSVFKHFYVISASRTLVIESSGSVPLFTTKASISSTRKFSQNAQFTVCPPCTLPHLPPTVITFHARHLSAAEYDVLTARVQPDNNDKIGLCEENSRHSKKMKDGASNRTQNVQIMFSDRAQACKRHKIQRKKKKRHQSSPYDVVNAKALCPTAECAF